MQDLPSIRIDLSSKTPAYEQIAEEIRALLVTRELPSGTSLPTVRQLAVDLNVHHNTVAIAYRILASEGWLELKRGRGVRVVARPKCAKPNRRTQNIFRCELRRLLAKAATSGMPAEEIAEQLRFQARQVKNWRLEEGNS